VQHFLNCIIVQTSAFGLQNKEYNEAASIRCLCWLPK